MIKVNQLSKKFGSLLAVNDVSLNVSEGEIFGLIGPDGAGKTTLIRVICGLLTPDAGEVRVLGLTDREREKGKDAGARNFGYMPQRFSLYGDLTVMENLLFFGEMYSLKKEVIIHRSEEILEITNLVAFKKRFADQLSGGMKQKLALTCALVTRPKLLILDEPTYGVDPEFRKEFWKILYQLNREGMTMLVSTPYMDEAELCTWVAFMNEGSVHVLDTPVGLKEKFPYQVWEVMADTKEPWLFGKTDGILDYSLFGDKYRLIMDKNVEAEAFIEQTLTTKGCTFSQLQKVAPSIEDVFVIMAGGK
ncbi:MULTISPECIES: ABC transporter ATP-binding protein [Dehalobacter]|jgi:ABC-2 type transport system ATP-binding protein|uniref:ATP-binding cassette domain-containing protein n=2 Tax=Dehalobacter restrictus TaxID=55583 RepID=A0A857DF35_9FIRM|nr:MULTISPECIES: ABC transporter ATP-binding protein [Dehalobacter]AHF08813.1 multidrug ABC transporter ATPase [Dehalobacter restrictus DSM 9455]MCG1024168.1 ABC transporter ATP-binding protein [Dehalobacter sp.]MDJ0305350.1 ABC transporter ATP-binding protein [Dehalobacter sp.]OCZ49989.1 multidrug ABC transporter ATP-binding protein [Dehalobacter sp. TeCB1]QGZ99310.1 ATP-binding cassette domain-containing protein [Dehalobacter restrictus]